MTHIIDDRARRRLVTAEHGAEAELVYDRDGDRLYLLHTGVPDAFRGQGTGGKLVTAALDAARRDGLVVVPWCPFARRWLREHTEAVGDVEIDWRTPPPDPARA
jgi:predicted GNAT family acetyltransferase